MVVYFYMYWWDDWTTEKKGIWRHNHPRDVGASCSHPLVVKRQIPPASWLLGLPVTKKVAGRGEKRVVRRRVCNALSVMLQSRGLGHW